MSTKLPYPEFSSEADEAAWLYEHDDELDHYFTPMDVSVREMLLRDHNLTLPETIIRVPLSHEDVACAKSIAEMSGLSAEEYLGRVVHEALQTKRAA